MKKGFTLAETLIVFSIIGVLATIMLTSFSKINPDKEKTMFKKGYSVAERMIGELVNDETLYPYNEDKIGFLNTIAVTIPGTASTVSGKKKFCTLFSTKVNVIGEPDIRDNYCKFTTSDGIDWTIRTSTKLEDYPKAIVIDTNGDKEPNCAVLDVEDTNLNSIKCSSADASRQDRFVAYYYADGRMTVKSNKEIEYLKSQNLKK